MNRVSFIAVIIVLSISCKKDRQIHPINNSRQLSSYSSDYITAYIDLQLELIKSTPGFAPPVSARVLGFIWLANYESTVNGINDHQSLENYLNITPTLPKADQQLVYDWAISGNACVSRITKKLFLTGSTAILDRIDSTETSQLYLLSNGLDTNVINRSVAFGRSIADSIFEWSKTDGGHLANLNIYPSYSPPTGPDKWVPTPAPSTSPYFNNKPALLYYWGIVRPFMLENTEGNAFLSAPPTFSTDTGSPFYKEIKTMYDTSFNLSAEQIQIARFWADELGSFSPAGHSISLTSTIIKSKNANLEKATLSLLKVGIAVHDCFINCFKIKYTYNLLRPITYIRNYIDPNWMSLIGTPPFPEYASCHSTQSAASAEVLSYEFGENTSFIDDSKNYVGYPSRSFNRIHDFAKEAAISRYYGGVHYLFSCNLGYDIGIVIGNNINQYLPIKKR